MKTPFRILIADYNAQRRQAIIRFFSGSYGLSDNFAIEVENKASLRNEILKNKRDISAVFVADRLPGAMALPILLESVCDLMADNESVWNLFGILDEQQAFDPVQNTSWLIIPAGEALPEDAKAGIKARFPLPRPLPVLDIEPQGSAVAERLFIETIRSLDPMGNIPKASSHIRKVVADFFPTAKRIHLSPLAPGFSGAKVFRAKVAQRSGADADFVLKLMRLDQTWKIESELKNWTKIRNQLGHHGFSVNHPERIPSSVDLEDYGKDGAVSGNWFCLAYGDLNALGKVKSLHSLYQESPNSDDFLPVVKAVVEALEGDLWGKGRWENLPGGRLWSADDAGLTEVGLTPPFRLTGPRKAHLLECLNTFSEAAKYYFGVSENGIQGIADLVLNGMAGEAVDKVVVSPVHGDLNANNILWWTDRKHPFFIDFAFYHEGLMVQDLARLEAEVRFELLDRDYLPGMAQGRFEAVIGSERLPAWKGLDDQVSEGTNVPDWGEDESLRKAYTLIQTIRGKAKSIYESISGAGMGSRFEREYATALLFHTVNAIGYDSLPHPKRIFALYSAARLQAALK